MSVKQIFDNINNACPVSYNLKCNNLTACNDLNCSNLNTTTINGNPVAIPISPGTSNQFFKTNNAGTATEWATMPDSLPGGAPNTVLRTDSLNNVEWSDTVSLANIESTTLLVANDTEVSGNLNLIGQNLLVNGNGGLANQILIKNALNELIWSSNIVAVNVTATGQLILSNVTGNANQIVQKTSLNVPGWVDNNRVSWWAIATGFDYNSNIVDGYVSINPAQRYNNLGGVIELHNSNTFFTCFVNGFFKVKVVIQASAQTDSTVGFSLRVNNVVISSGILFPSQTYLSLDYVGTVSIGANIDLRSVRVGTATAKTNLNNLSSYFIIERIY